MLPRAGFRQGVRERWREIDWWESQSEAATKLPHVTPRRSSNLIAGVSASDSMWNNGRENVGRLDGKIAVVTGAGSGIGQEAARAFAREGAIVGILDRNAPAVEATVREIGDSAFPLVA